MKDLEKKILASLASGPKIYPDLAKETGVGDSLFLARFLCHMALDKKIYYTMPNAAFVTQWPVYSKDPLPKKFKFPTRPGK